MIGAVRAGVCVGVVHTRGTALAPRGAPGLVAVAVCAPTARTLDEGVLLEDVQFLQRSGVNLVNRFALRTHQEYINQRTRWHE
jgi:hypothetical protein